MWNQVAHDEVDNSFIKCDNGELKSKLSIVDVYVQKILDVRFICLLICFII